MGDQLALPDPYPPPADRAPAIADDDFLDEQPPMPLRGGAALAPFAGSVDVASDSSFEGESFAPIAVAAGQHGDEGARQGPEPDSAVNAGIAELIERWHSSGLPMDVDGNSLTLEPHFGPRQRYARLRVRCNNPLHGDCGTSRSLSLSRHFGMSEVWGFLARWLEASDEAGHGGSRRTHVAYRPTLAEVADQLRGRGMLV